MELNKYIAQKIVKRTMKIIKYSVNVMDKNGIIIASGDPNRLNQKHVGATLAIRNNQVVEVTQYLSEKWNFESKPGINVPIVHLGQVLGVVGISGEPEDVRHYAELVKMTAELILEQQILLEQEKWSHRYKEEFIINLLHEDKNLQHLNEQASFFNIDISKKYVVVIIKIINPTLEKLQELVMHIEQYSPNEHLAILSQNQIVILKTFVSDDIEYQSKIIEKLLPNHVSIQDYKVSIGMTSDNKVNIHLSYKTAIDTLQYGEHFFPRKTFYFFSQYQVPVLLSNSLASWQAYELFKPIKKLNENDPNMILRKTLRQYFSSNCDLNLTKEKLFIHINTLRYRLTKIEQITSLSFNKIEDKFILYLSTIT